MTRDWPSFNKRVISEFRENDGVVPHFGELPLVIVHAIGAKSGAPRPVPLIPVFDDGSTYLFATNEGSPTHPAWYFNLAAHAAVIIEHALGGPIARVGVTVAELSPADAAAVLSKRAASEPRLVAYLEAAAPRRIPVFRIEPSLAP